MESPVSTSNLYRILQVSPDADPSVISAAFKALSRQHHPDVGGDEQTYRRILRAHEILGDRDRRQEYDRQRLDDIGKSIGQYQVLSEIAHGGFGPTYKAQHLMTKKLACIKRFHPNNDPDSPNFNVPRAFLNKILRQEAEAFWDLRHHALPSVRDLVEVDGDLALIMSFIPGPTLEQLVEKVGRIDPEHVAWITERILNALSYLHQNGVVHGDLKPQNVIVDSEKHTVTLLDFGLSLVKPNSGSRAKGWTEGFAPPEAKDAAGKPLLPESDLYSLGMTMVYALGGDYQYVETKQIPKSVPDQIFDFVRRLIVLDVISRPHWGKEDLCDTMQKIRVQTFGRAHSNMKPLPTG